MLNKTTSHFVNMTTTIEEMINEQLIARGISDEAVLEAMATVDRSLFVPEDEKEHAYEDGPLPIGHDQTISQPFIVAYMAEKLKLSPEDKVLEIGSGCGYNAAVLSQIVDEVYSVEIIDWLADLAKENLSKTDISNIQLKHADGYEGWPEAAPFDAIELTAAPHTIPKKLLEQLKIGGKMLAPIGKNYQQLKLITRVSEDDYEEKDLIPVRFVPMTGQIQAQ